MHLTSPSAKSRSLHSIERHADLFKEIRGAGAQLELLGDGDVSGAIWAAKDDGRSTFSWA